MSVDTTSLDTDYGIGTTVALTAMENQLKTRNCPVDYILINIDTLVRNRQRSDEKYNVQLWVKDVLSDVLRIKVALEQSFQLSRGILLFYHSDYQPYIPAVVRRPMTPPRVELQKVTEAVYPHIVKMIKGFVGGNLVCMAGWFDNKRIIPFETMSNIIRGSNIVPHPMMLSSYPADYHMVHRHPTFLLVDSYTGTIRDRATLGEKVLKSDALPFTLHLHSLLGDSKLFAASVTGKRKKELITYAVAEKWKQKDNVFIRRRLVELRFFERSKTYPLLKDV
jgi:hypothetical protein